MKHSEIFIRSEIENFIFNFILLVIIFALNDDAFEINIKSIKNIFRIRV
jgi:hypothetical protein